MTLILTLLYVQFICIPICYIIYTWMYTLEILILFYVQFPVYVYNYMLCIVYKWMYFIPTLEILILLYVQFPVYVYVLCIMYKWMYCIPTLEILTLSSFLMSWLYNALGGPNATTSIQFSLKHHKEPAFSSRKNTQSSFERFKKG